MLECNGFPIAQARASRAAVVGELDDMEFVEGDLGVRKVLFDPRLEGRPHVDAGVGHRLALAAMRLEEIGEFLRGRRILAVGDVDDLAARHVDEQADVVVAAPRGRPGWFLFTHGVTLPQSLPPQS
jgi:hypothetical protein